MGRGVLGEFEHQVLLTILRLGPETYTVPLVLELEERTQRSVAPAAVYIALRRLENKGFLTSRFSPAQPEIKERARRYFKLTDEAMQALRRSPHALNRPWEGLETVLDES